MQNVSVSSTLTVYHDGQFWVGVVERFDDGALRVARIVFGAEPSDEEIYQLVVNGWGKLRFSEGVDVTPDQVAKNPKRRQRAAARAVGARGVGTKAQQALADQRQSVKAESAHLRAQAKEQTRQARYELRVEKRKQKKKGH